MINVRVITNYYLTTRLLPAPFARINTINTQKFAVKVRLGGKACRLHDIGHRIITGKQPLRRLVDTQLIHILRHIHARMPIDGL
ncbi:hypothetical protein D3C78_1823220 [compost metagenome]